MRVKYENGAAPECKVGGNGKSPRKPAQQRHRPARFTHVKIREWPDRGLNPVRLGPRRKHCTLARRSDEALATRVSVARKCDKCFIFVTFSVLRLSSPRARAQLHGCDIYRRVDELHSDCGEDSRQAICQTCASPGVDFVIGSQFIRQALDDSEPIAELQVNKGALKVGWTPASKVKKRRSDTGDTNTHAQCLIAPTRKACGVSGVTLYCKRNGAGFPFKLRSYVVVRPLASHQGESDSILGRVAPGFCMWGSCRTMKLVGGFSRGSPVLPSLAFRCYSVLISLHPQRLSKPRCYEAFKSPHSLSHLHFRL
ncbi:hypothetical protein PR048_025920 [Dryococelus australis]|uniref:Uncharacterized protein n=1 Tax=Dryococelus australis TaxID=614101 RepID=A0ABQ9GJU7_9NEOP|nr:hypothetical protein PR048_025920 [Dryococelus australis]